MKITVRNMLLAKWLPWSDLSALLSGWITPHLLFVPNLCFVGLARSWVAVTHLVPPVFMLFCTHLTKSQWKKGRFKELRTGIFCEKFRVNIKSLTIWRANREPTTLGFTLGMIPTDGHYINITI